jgi:DnaK suppressor protein
MTTRDLEAIKQKLLTEREFVKESLRRNMQHTTSEADDTTTRDSGDLASASHDKGVLYQLQESDSRRLKLINEVLIRIDRDDYGTCEECGEEIGKVRLAAIPWATHCLTCQERIDWANLLAREEYTAA